MSDIFVPITHPKAGCAADATHASHCHPSLCKAPCLLEASPPLQVEAKYPALLFKQQLDAFVQKIFPMLRDNVKKEITPQLAACIHAPRTATTRGRRTRDLGHSLSGDAPGTPGTHLWLLMVNCVSFSS